MDAVKQVSEHVRHEQVADAKRQCGSENKPIAAGILHVGKYAQPRNDYTCEEEGSHTSEDRVGDCVALPSE